MIFRLKNIFGDRGGGGTEAARRRVQRRNDLTVTELTDEMLQIPFVYINLYDEAGFPRTMCIEVINLWRFVCVCWCCLLCVVRRCLWRTSEKGWFSTARPSSATKTLTGKLRCGFCAAVH